MVGHTSFGARTGGASIILGTLLVVLALAFNNSIQLLLQTFPTAVLGVILFLTGGMLAVGNLPAKGSKREMLIIIMTAGMAIWNVAIAFILGIVLDFLGKRGYLEAH
jgi:hypothetical protein